MESLAFSKLPKSSDPNDKVDSSLSTRKKAQVGCGKVHLLHHAAFSVRITVNIKTSGSFVVFLFRLGFFRECRFEENDQFIVEVIYTINQSKRPGTGSEKGCA